MTNPETRRPTAVELFSGAGGMALGFEAAGFDVLAAVDLDPVHLAAHERNFPLCEPLCGDVAAMSASDVLTAARAGWARRHPDTTLVGSVDCVFGGPSCQGFSVIGRQDPGDPRNGLVSEFARLVIAIRPRYFVLENVPGLLDPTYADVLEGVRDDLRRAGYWVADPWEVNASDHQVPQDRSRVFLIGARAGESRPSKPSPCETSITVGEAIRDLPTLSRFKRLRSRDSLELTGEQYKTMKARQTSYVKRLNGALGLSDPRRWNPRWLSSVGVTSHSDDVVKRLSRVKAGRRDQVGRLPRLDPCGLSPTLRAGTGRDHGSFTAARPIHPTSPRVITVREAARIHGFPDWFGFHATKWQGFRQVGNAVPPPLAQAVAETITAALGSAPSRRKTKLALGSGDLLELTMSEAADRYELDASQLPVDVRRPGQVEGAA